MNWFNKYRFAVTALVGLLLFPAFAYATGQVVSGTVTFNAGFIEQATSITTFQIPATVAANLSYTNGTAPNQVDTIFAKNISLAATTQTFALNSVVDPAGNTVSFARVREFVIVNLSTTAGFDLGVSSGASNGVTWLPASGTLTCRAGGTLRISDPVSTGSGSGNTVGTTTFNVTVNAGANTVNFLILIVGGSAA
jgi:hypothetical protein